jgi:Na+/serine symporter
MKNTFKFALVGAVLAVAAPMAAAADCKVISKQVTEAITAKPKLVLVIVAKQIAANEACAGEVVKAAIVITEADKKLVAQIVEQAIEAAPKKISLIANSALAVAPDAYVEIMVVMANKVPNGSAEALAKADKDNDGILTIEEVAKLSAQERNLLFKSILRNPVSGVFYAFHMRLDTATDNTPANEAIKSFKEAVSQLSGVYFSTPSNGYSTN